MEDKGNVYTLAGCFLIFCSTFIYLFWPESDEVYDMFFMDIITREGAKYRMMISKQAYYDYLATRGAFVGMHVIILGLSRFKWQMWVIVGAWFGYLIDYIIIYNQPYFYFKYLGYTLPGMYALLMAVVIFFVLLYTAYKEWKVV